MWGGIESGREGFAAGVFRAPGGRMAQRSPARRPQGMALVTQAAILSTVDLGDDHRIPRWTDGAGVGVLSRTRSRSGFRYRSAAA
jgi:hypothetical protein